VFALAFDAAQVVQRRGEVRDERQRALLAGFGLFVFLAVEIHDAQIAVRHRHVGFQRDRLFTVRDRLVELLQLAQDLAEVCMEQRDIAVDPDSSLDQLGGQRFLPTGARSRPAGAARTGGWVAAAISAAAGVPIPASAPATVTGSPASSPGLA